MTEFWITALGIAAATTTTGSFIPQVVRTLKTRKTRDFSWGYLFLFSSGTFLWLIYGVLRKDIAVVGANATTLVLILIITGVKVRTRKSSS